jgi:hypothetical protein
MPAIYTRGDIDFVATPGATFEGKKWKLLEVDCPLPGTYTEFVHPRCFMYRVVGEPQPDEAGRIWRLATPLSNTLLDIVLENFGVRKLCPTYRGDPDYDRFSVPEKCCTICIFIQLMSQKWTIKAVTRVATTTGGGKTYAAGSVLGTYEIIAPVKYRFLLTRKWNPECCPNPPSSLPVPDPGVWQPDIVDQDIEDFFKAVGGHLGPSESESK